MRFLSVTAAAMVPPSVLNVKLQAVRLSVSCFVSFVFISALGGRDIKISWFEVFLEIYESVTFLFHVFLHAS